MSSIISAKERLELVIASIMEEENLPREAAIAGAQRFALDEALDLEMRSKREYAAGRVRDGDILSTEAFAYRKAMKELS